MIEMLLSEIKGPKSDAYAGHLAMDFRLLMCKNFCDGRSCRDCRLHNEDYRSMKLSDLLKYGGKK